MLTRTIALFSLCVAAALFGASQSDAQPGKKGPKGGFGKGPGGRPDIERLEADLDRLMAQVEKTKADLARAKEFGRGKKGGFEGKKGKGWAKGWGKGEFKKKDGKKETARPDFPPFGKGKKGFGMGYGAWGKKGWGPMGNRGFGREGFGPDKMSPEMIKTRYEFYKKLYEESQRDARKGKGGPKGKGKGFEGKKKGMGERGGPPFGKGKGRGFGPMGGGFGKKFEQKKEFIKPTPPAGPMGIIRGGGDSVEARIDRLSRELDALRNELKKKKR